MVTKVADTFEDPARKTRPDRWDGEGECGHASGASLWLISSSNTPRDTTGPGGMCLDNGHSLSWYTEPSSSEHLYAMALYSFPLLQRLDKIDKDLSPLPDHDKDPGN